MTSNPMSNETVYQSYAAAESPMTVAGSINKTLILLAIVALTSAYTWYLAASGFADKVMMFMWGGIIAGFISVFAMRFSPQNSMPLSLTYAVCEGLALGGISAMYEAMYNGIVIQALGGTFASLFAMLLLYRTGVIRATDKLRGVVSTAVLSVLIFYIFMFVANLMHLKIATILSAGPIGIGISAVICVIASACFIFDFDFIEKGAQSYAPKYFEWYGACSLLVTIIWLYLEILRLIARVNRSR